MSLDTKSTIQTFSVKLSKETYFSWLQMVHTVYANQCTHIFAHGLIDLVLTDSEWLDLNGGDDTILRPVRERPADPADNASAAVVAGHNRKVGHFVHFKEISAQLKPLLLESIGVTNVELISDEIHDTRNLTHSDIVFSMVQKYGKTAGDTISAWKKQIMLPIAADIDIEHFLAMHKKLHGNLAKVKQPMAEFDKIASMTTALHTRPAAGMVIASYKEKNPDVGTQTYANLSTYIIQQIPNMEVTTASMYAAHVTSIDFETRVADAVAKALPAAVAAAMLPYANLMQARPSKPKFTKYCYKHGYCTHLGTECTVMLGAPSTYTKAMMKAKSHTETAGGSTKNA